MACKVSLGDSNYNLAGLDHTWAHSIITPTPPSTTNVTWYVNPCGSLADTQCPEGTIICGIEEVKVDDKVLVAEIIPVARTGTQRNVAEIPGGAEGVMFNYNGEKWGETPVTAEIQYICGKEERTVFVNWSGAEFKAEIETPSACIGAKDKPPGESSGGWGFFSFLFLLIVIAFFAFVGVAIAQNRRIADVGPLSEIIKELPYLLKELWDRIVGTFTTSRGGYSAV